MSTAVRARASALLVLVLASAGCSHLPHWSWHRKPPPPPPQVHELLITRPDGREAAFPQYWKGNTLVIDLQPAGSSGSVAMRPREHTLWPVRLAFRVMPGQFEVLEVRAHQRMLLPITPSGARPIDLELDPGVFIMKSPEIAVSWGPAAEAVTSEPAVSRPAGVPEQAVPATPAPPPAAPDHSPGN
ncbi:MAG: hypothetical protein JOZ12_10115 [Sinobacteraceae bacterium]|nr:hypothetical protein [Nevskiaceae bacterium]